MFRLSPETNTLYAELLEQLSALEAHRSIGALRGCFTSKNVKGGEYFYFQYLDINGVQKQAYLGRKSPALERLAERFREEKKLLRPDAEKIAVLCSQIRVGGGNYPEPSAQKVLSSLAESGVFRLGGVLVGTHAFSAMGNMLGVRWGSGAKTQDIDIAASKDISVAVPDFKTDIHGALKRLDMGFLPVPQLDAKNPSTSFKVRGSTLIVDLLTPAFKKDTKPVFIPALNAAAQPLPFLDYLLRGDQKAALTGGRGALINIPAPARFALHKLIISRDRDAFMHVKTEKDLAQAAALLDVLAEDRPGDISLAFEEIKKRGPSWTGKLKKSLAIFKAKYPAVSEKMFSSVPSLSEYFNK